MESILLTVKVGEREERISLPPGRSVKEMLDIAGLRVRAGCRGLGACGFCKIRVEAGEVAGPDTIEKLQLSEQELTGGVRLACQVKPATNLRITLINPAPESGWRTPPSPGYQTPYSLSAPAMPTTANGTPRPLGVAVDLGTTNISLTLFDLSSGELLAARVGANPQHSFGADVIGRLTAACEAPENLARLQQQVTDAIGAGLTDIAIREGISLQQVVSLVLVGNTAMLALLSGRNYDQLLNPRNWMDYVDCLPSESAAWQALWGLAPEARLNIVRPLAGFVGSDLIAGMIATRLPTLEAPAMLIDFGTNTEIALWDGQQFAVTSAAGGPAFEGSGISCGMPAEPGAVYRAAMNDDGQWVFRTIANMRISGICGTGLVDVLAVLLEQGLLSPRGNFTTGNSNRYVLRDGQEASLSITKRDVDLIQRAKGAIGAGVVALCRKFGLEAADLNRICIGGAFGYHLDVRNAQLMGLLPPVPPEKVELYGNTALYGCADLLLSRQAEELLSEIGTKSGIVNLSAEPDFERLFLELESPKFSCLFKQLVPQKGNVR